MWRTIVASSILVVACDSSPRLKYAHPGAKFTIMGTRSLQVGVEPVWLRGHEGIWQAGVDVWRPVFVWDVENRSDEPWCVAVYVHYDGPSDGEWGNGVPTLVAPRSTETQIAGLLGEEGYAYESQYLAKRAADGECVGFPSVDDGIPSIDDG